MKQAGSFNRIYQNFIGISAQLILLAWLVVSVHKDGISYLQATLLLGGITLAFMIQLFFAIRDQDLPSVESFWGGLDGGLGGWQISRAASYILIVVVFGSLFYLVAISTPDKSN